MSGFNDDDAVYDYNALDDGSLPQLSQEDYDAIFSDTVSATSTGSYPQGSMSNPMYFPPAGNFTGDFSNIPPPTAAETAAFMASYQQGSQYAGTPAPALPSTGSYSQSNMASSMNFPLGGDFSNIPPPTPDETADYMASYNQQVTQGTGAPAPEPQMMPPPRRPTSTRPGGKARGPLNQYQGGVGIYNAVADHYAQSGRTWTGGSRVNTRTRNTASNTGLPSSAYPQAGDPTADGGEYGVVVHGKLPTEEEKKQRVRDLAKAAYNKRRDKKKDHLNKLQSGSSDLSGKLDEARVTNIQLQTKLELMQKLYNPTSTGQEPTLAEQLSQMAAGPTGAPASQGGQTNPSFLAPSTTATTSSAGDNDDEEEVEYPSNMAPEEAFKLRRKKIQSRSRRKKKEEARQIEQKYEAQKAELNSLTMENKSLQTQVSAFESLQMQRSQQQVGARHSSAYGSMQPYGPPSGSYNRYASFDPQAYASAVNSPAPMNSLDVSRFETFEDFEEESGV